MDIEGFGRTLSFSDVAQGALFVAQNRDGVHWCIKGHHERDGENIDVCVVISPTNPDFGNKPGIWDASVLGRTPVYEIADAIIRPLYDEGSISIQIGYDPDPGKILIFDYVPYLSVLVGRSSFALVNVITGEVQTAPPSTEYTRISGWKVYREGPLSTEPLFAWPLQESDSRSGSGL